MTDEREGIERDDGDGGPGGAGTGRRAYGAPELVEYGTVAKLTRGVFGSVNDLPLLMTMMACL